MRIFCDGMISEPRLAHPEGLAVDRDGYVWCGGELGQIYRISPDGTEREVIASTGGFCLGMAFDQAGDLYVCDLAHAAVYRLRVATGELSRFSTGVAGHRLRVPNFPVVDPTGRLYVSDSWQMREPGPGILRFEPDGSGEVWHPGPFDFANGMALDVDASRLYVAETFGQRVTMIDIRPDGSAGSRTTLAALPDDYPDGLAVATDGSVLVGCYQPSRILRIDPTGRVSTMAEDVSAHTLAHPTNIAFTGNGLLAANHGRWHLTSIPTTLRGLPLPPN
jgi:sugar lactone lactonase YvrE